MTILAGLVLNLGPNSTPFAMIASDSRSKAITVLHNQDEILKKETVDCIDDAKKVFKPSKNIIVGFAGNGFGELLTEEQIKKIIPQDVNLKEAAERVKKFFISKAIATKNPLYSFSIIMGGLIEGKPALATFRVSLNEANFEINYRIPRQYEILGSFSGLEVPAYLKEELHQRVNKSSGNITVVRRALSEYVIKASRLYPDDCNEIVQVERLR